MTTTRVLLHDVIRNQSMVIQAQCQIKSRFALRRKDPARTFDEFPCCLLDPNTFVEKQEAFSKAIRTNDTNEIKKYIQDIADLACQNLLNDEGKIKHEIIAVLRWREFPDQLNSHYIVSSFINAVTAQINEKLARFILNHPQGYNQFTREINRFIEQDLDKTIAKHKSFWKDSWFLAGCATVASVAAFGLFRMCAQDGTLPSRAVVEMSRLNHR